MKQCPQCQLKYPNESTHCFVDGVELAPLRDPRIGTTLSGRYLIEDVIGEGGMATVYRATKGLGGRPCAIKVMSLSYSDNDVIRERFRREAKAAQKLAHPNIIEIFDQGDTDDGTLYLVMELLEGEPLSDVVERGKVALERALPIWIQIARALARAHDFEVIHRDLKPENIFLARDADGSEVVKLLDFGIARSMHDKRLTGVGEVFGTPQYMAPERITSIEAGPGADLYAVGIIMFEMLTGRLPFDGDDVAAFFLKHLKEKPLAPRSVDSSIPEALDKLVLQLLEKDPKDRPVDAHRLHNDLVSIAGTIGIRIPKERGLTAGEPEGRAPASSLAPAGVDSWLRRTAVFEQMLRQVYKTAPPGEMLERLRQVKKYVAEISGLRKKGAHDERLLAAVDKRGRETRERFGHAMDALGVDTSRARDEVRAAQAEAEKFAPRVEAAQRAVMRSHENILLWEGRSGFSEPYADLAEAYRATARRVDAWLQERQRFTKYEEAVTAKEGEVADLDFQIQELRNSLASNEERVEAERNQCEARLSEVGGRAVELESELLELAAQFCAPLRSRPELKPLFQELEAGAAA